MCTILITVNGGGEFLEAGGRVGLFKTNVSLYTRLAL